MVVAYCIMILLILGSHVRGRVMTVSVKVQVEVGPIQVFRSDVRCV